MTHARRLWPRPKVSAAMTLEFLLRTHARTHDQQTLEMVEHTCHKMAEGVVRPLGGGFHRYSTASDGLSRILKKALRQRSSLAPLPARLSSDERRFLQTHRHGNADYVVLEMTDASVAASIRRRTPTPRDMKGNSSSGLWKRSRRRWAKRTARSLALTMSHSAGKFRGQEYFEHPALDG